MTANEWFTWGLVLYGAIRLAIDFAMWIDRPKRKARR